MAEQADIKPKRKLSYKLLIGLVIFLILVIIGVLASMQYMLFKAKAEGIAIGYARAAASAYQMGRQIPDSIFEVDLYRIEVQSTQPSAGQPYGVTVYVKDRYTNMTHYTFSQNVNGQSIITPSASPQ
jgi:flagellar basal body-associated protein FliL